MFGRQPHALQPAGTVDQQRPVLPHGLGHILVGAKIGERVAGLPGDQHPVEPGKALCVHLALKLAADLLLGLPTQLQRDDLARPFADAMGDVIPSDVEHLAVVGDPAHQDVGMRMAGVVVIDRDPFELGAQVGFHLRHQVAGGLAKVRQLHALLGGDNEAELMAVLSPPVEEGGTIGDVLVGGIDLALLPVAGHAVALQITQMRVHRLATDELASTRAPTLRIELHDPRLDRHPARAGPDATRVPAPPVPALQSHRDLSAPAARIAPPARLPPPGQSVRVAARPADGLMHLADEGLGPRPNRARARHPRSARATVAHLAGTDAESLFVGRHDATIGGPESAAQDSKSRHRAVA